MAAHDAPHGGKFNLKEALEEQKKETDLSPLPIPIPFPLRLPNSGLYTYSSGLIPTPVPPIPINQPNPHPDPGPQGGQEGSTAEAGGAIPLPFFLNEELRLDVDGYYPQMKASGRITRLLTAEANWIANVAQTAPNTYEGAIWYKNGNVALIPYANVKIQVTRGFFAPTSATVTFSGPGTKVLVFSYKSRYFHPVNFEFDCAQGVTPILSYNTGSHPNRPASLPVESLTIVNVFRRMGFDVSVSAASDVVPIAEAGADAKWSDSEMHDAMQIHWSKFANIPQWAMWTFFASLHESGTSLGGIMFDDIGPAQRQGTSLFLDSFIKNPPAGDPSPAAWVNRMIFWTACHEMGHTFNLAHSWQKALGTQWIPLANEPLARSFMNYPYVVPGGQSAFFGDFQFRFSDQELLFTRHAPYRFVEQGNAAWFDNHGFRDMRRSAEPKLDLRLEGPRPSNQFDFLEPVVLHLKLRNTSENPQLVHEKLLASPEDITVIIKKRGKPARQLLSYVQRCWHEKQMVLGPGEEMADSLFLSVGRNGWDVAEPGYYTIQAALHLEDEDIVSQPLTIRVAPPKGYDEELLAQDVFSDAVGRVLTFDGSTYLNSANDTLREVTERLPDSKAAVHARVALAGPLAMNAKSAETGMERPKLRVAKADPAEARKLLAVLVEKRDSSIATLGQIDYDYYVNRFKNVLARTAKG